MIAVTLILFTCLIFTLPNSVLFPLHQLGIKCLNGEIKSCIISIGAELFEKIVTISITGWSLLYGQIYMVFINLWAKVLK